jgi:hypothetical protein
MPFTHIGVRRRQGMLTQLPPRQTRRVVEFTHSICPFWHSAHAWVLQARVSLSGGQAVPPFIGGWVIVRVRVCVPPPQVLLHMLQSLHALTWQFTGMAHGWVLQARVSRRAGQAMPPFIGCWVTVRVRNCIPPPQALLHMLQSLQALTWQSTGMAHGWVLQSRVSLSGGQAWPPLVGGWVTVRVRVCVPPPQALLHMLQALQALTWQLFAWTQVPSRHTPPGQLDSFAA